MHGIDIRYPQRVIEIESSIGRFINVLCISNEIILFNQVGASTCAVRYRTLSGGIGRTPSPTHSSDYVDDDDEDDLDDDITTNTTILNGITNATIDSSNVTSTNNLKPKRSNHSLSLAKASTISYQKASVHNVRLICAFVFSLLYGKFVYL